MLKKLSTLFAFAAMTLGAMTANAQTYKVDIDNVDNVIVDINNTEVTGLQNGLNEIEMNGELYLRIIAKENIIFTEVTEIDAYYNEENDLLYQVNPNENGL